MFKNIKITLYIGLIFLLGVHDLSYAQSIKKRIDNLDKVDYSAINDSIGDILWDIYLKPPAIAKKYTNQVLKKTKGISTEIYLYAKLFSLNYDKTNYLSKLDSIYCEAKKTNLVSRMEGVLFAKSTYYKENERYDSSMVAVLEALNIHQGTENDDFTVACLQLIGDLYYVSGLYNDAENIFLKINKLKGALGQWNNWRKRVIRNNLALIDVKRGNYYDAIDKFNTSLNEVKHGNLGVVDSIAAIYLFNKLAETYYLFNNFEKALQYYQIGIIQAINHKQDESIVSRNAKYKQNVLSNAINQVLDINFSCYINKLRMQEVIRLIQEGFFENHKIEGIAYYSGFRSRTAFNKAFIDYTGVTPSYFLKNLETALNQVKNKENKD